VGAVFWAGGAAAGGSAGEVLLLLAGINVAVALFNLLPGLPLDGGRLLRALLWRGTGDGDRAVRVAAGAGRLLGGIMMVAGPVLLAFGALAAAGFLAAVGWFLYRSATAIRRTSGRLATPVAEVMVPVSAWVPPEAEAGGLASAPVAVVVDRRVVGTVAEAPADGSSAGSVMTPLRRGDLVAAETPIGAVLGLLRRRRRPLVVVDEGRMVGLVSSELARRWLGEVR
jgi:membrane-associated protease RseP (regulator of RpoE activity)